MADTALQPMPTRTIGRNGPAIAPVCSGGHGLLGGFKERPEQSIDEAAETLRFLVDHGMTRFDYTFGSERRAYRDVIERAGVAGKLKPIIWYMDQEKREERKEESLDDVLANVRFHLEELGIERAGAVVKWDNKWPDEWPDYTEDAMAALKDELTDTVGIESSPARANEAYLARTADLGLRRAVVLLVAPRCRRRRLLSRAWTRCLFDGSVSARGDFRLPGVDAERLVRPWIKWVLQEPACFGFAVGMQSRAEAEAVVAACDGEPMTLEEQRYLRSLNLPVQHVDYHVEDDGSSRAVPMTVVSSETQRIFAEGTNMLSGSLIRQAR